jgi:XTP/dITP diphosphohydrolase
MIFLIATQNQHKKKEFDRILAPLGIEIKTAGDLGLSLPDVEETGSSFEENALLKARSGCLVSGQPTLADDSGLCVDALGGAPGIYSARYSGGDDEANNDKLLAELEGVPEEKRTAHYACAIAAVFPDGREFVVLGTVDGHIGFSRHGQGGFGYDPLFYYGDKTYAEVPPEVKDQTSHRSVALHKMCKLLKEEIKNDQ